MHIVTEGGTSFGFCLTTLFLWRLLWGQRSPEETAEAVRFTDWMPLLPPNSSVKAVHWTVHMTLAPLHVTAVHVCHCHMLYPVLCVTITEHSNGWVTVWLWLAVSVESPEHITRHPCHSRLVHRGAVAAHRPTVEDVAEGQRRHSAGEHCNKKSSNNWTHWQPVVNTEHSVLTGADIK